MPTTPWYVWSACGAECVERKESCRSRQEARRHSLSRCQTAKHRCALRGNGLLRGPFTEVRPLLDVCSSVPKRVQKVAQKSRNVGRLLKQANLVLNRKETRTVLRVANAGALWTKGSAEVPQQEKRPQLRLVTHRILARPARFEPTTVRSSNLQHELTAR